MKIGILIPVYNNLKYTVNCLKNIDKALRVSNLLNEYEIILIDDGSSDGTAEWVKTNYTKVHVLVGNGDLWWSGAINIGAQFALDKLYCSHVLLWNNDIFISDSYFTNVVKTIKEHNNNTIIGSKIFTDMQKSVVWSMGGYFYPKSGKFGMYAYMQPDISEFSQIKEVHWLTGMGTIVPADIIRKIGYWNSKLFPQYHGDTEFTYRAYIYDYRIIVDPRLEIWNDISNTGLSHEGKIKNLLKLLTDKRSLYNIKTNLHFYKMYAKSIWALRPLLISYSILLGSFIKRAIFNLFMGTKEIKVKLKNQV